MIRYGFQRMALLGSAGYRRAELPLDASVSLIAPNNAGKTKLVRSAPNASPHPKDSAIGTTKVSRPPMP